MSEPRDLDFDETLDVLSTWVGQRVDVEVRFIDHDAALGWLCGTSGTLTSFSRPLPRLERWTGRLNENDSGDRPCTFNIVREAFARAQITQNAPEEDSPGAGYSPELVIVHRGIETVVAAYL